MPYSVNSYSNVGGSPFQQYENQQYQNYLQQQQLQQQRQQPQQGQQNPAFGGQQPNLGGGIQYGGQQNYGGWPPSGQQQYNPLPQYNFNQQQPPQDQGNSLQRGFGGIENPKNTQYMGMYQPADAGGGLAPPGSFLNLGNDVRNMGQSKYPVNPVSSPMAPPQNLKAYNPLQPYSFGSQSTQYPNYGGIGSPAGGTGNFQYY